MPSNSPPGELADTWNVCCGTATPRLNRYKVVRDSLPHLRRVANTTPFAPPDSLARVPLLPWSQPMPDGAPSVLTAAFRAEQLTQAIAAGAAQVPFPRATDRTAWAGIDAASRAEILAHAENLVAQPWPVLTLSQRLAFERTGSRRAFEAPYFDRRRCLTILTLAAAADPHPRWADALIDGIGLLLTELSWCLPAHDAPPGGQRRRLPDPANPVLDL